MRWSQYYLYTSREVPSDAEVVSHQLMVRAGMIKKQAAGIYSLLPFGQRSEQKLVQIVRRELDRAGAMELTMPTIQPAELWKETGRWGLYGKELLRVEDRHGRGFCYAPTAEEVVTDIVRHDVRSYKQLPINLYQIHTKFRDEIRPRFGLMRGREFLMKDAYSFHATEESLDEAYRAMHDAYCAIFAACGLDYKVVEADTGQIGGSDSQEFMVLAQTGESEIVSCECGYAANTERAVTGRLETPDAVGGEEDAVETVSTPDLKSVPEVAKFLGIEERQMLKAMIYLAVYVDDESDSEDGREELVMAAIRGDREINEIKLRKVLGCQHLDLAGEEAVRGLTGAPTGFAGPVGLDGVRLVVDSSAAALPSFVCGANEADAHLENVRWGRDAEIGDEVDILLADDGDPCPRCGDAMQKTRGIETGHIFKLGTKYSADMGCNFLDSEGNDNPMTMGCYGLGIGRTVAAAIEQNHDENGIIWPKPLAPYTVLLMALNPQDDEVMEAADALYDELREKDLEVFYDDRQERPGVKFNDADLIGLPVRVVIGKRGLKEGKVEISLRRDREKEMVDSADAVSRIVELATA